MELVLAPTTITGEPPARERLGHLALRGGAYLAVREAIGMVIRLAGVVTIVREIGPSAYGIYSGASAFALFVVAFAQGGVEVYLIRHPGELEPRRYNQAFTFLLLTSVTLTALALGGTFALGPWLRPTGVLLPLRMLLLTVPINVLWAPAQAHIERRFGYRQMGMLEIGGDLVLYGTAIPLAIEGAGAWALVAGFFAWQSFLLIGSLLMSGLRPRWDWDGESMRAMARHSFTFSLNGWVHRLGGLVNPLVVGGFAGAAGVGYVSFAQRLVDTVGFARRGAYRLGMVAMSKVPDDDGGRLRYAVEEGSLLQLIALAVPFACFGACAHWVVPLLFGAEWTRAIPLYAMLGLATVLNTTGFVQNTLLFSKGQNGRVALASVISTAALAIAAVVFVRLLGIDGFGVATLVALVSLVYTHRVTRSITRLSYRTILPFAVALGPAVLIPLLPMPTGLIVLVPMLIVLLLPAQRAEEARIFSLVRGSLRRGAS